MGLFDKIKSAFGESSQKPELPEDKGQFVKCYDDKGKPYQIPRTQWRNQVLPQRFKKVWNDPDQLYDTIIAALRDNFFPEAIEPGKHLIKIDANKSRAYNALGVVYLKNNLITEAEQILKDGINIAEDKSVLTTNLAKVYAAKGQQEIAMQTLWKAMELDPNQDNGLDWFTAIASENGGENARLEAYKKIASLPNSWRAKLHVARQHLKTKEFEQAKSIYKEVLNLVPNEPDAVWIISGDLGNANKVEEIFELVYPIFSVEKHGVNASVNLIQACIATGRKAEGLKIIGDFRKLQRYDYAKIITQFENQIQSGEIKEDIFKKKVVVILSEEPKIDSFTLNIQDYIENGKSFIPFFSSVEKFNESTKGMVKNPNVEMDGMLLLSMLKGKETLKFNPGLADELTFQAPELINKYSSEIEQFNLKMKDLKEKHSAPPSPK